MNPEPQRQVEIAKKRVSKKAEIRNPNFAKEPGQSFLWLNI
jgi:hypothetical protein